MISAPWQQPPLLPLGQRRWQRDLLFRAQGHDEVGGRGAGGGVLSAEGEGAVQGHQPGKKHILLWPELLIRNYSIYYKLNRGATHIFRLPWMLL